MKGRPIPPGPFKIRKDDLNSRLARLPLWARRFIAQLETRADPSGDIQEMADLREQRDGLVKMVEQLKKENRRLRRSLDKLRSKS
jgi:hypothetical protein